MSATCIFPTAAAVSAPVGALPVFPHCRSSARSRRSLPIISPLPQQCPLPQEPSQYFPTAAAVSAPAGALSIFPHCRSSVRSRRSLPIISPLPQQCPLPQELHQYLPTAAAVFAPTGGTIYISPLPQQYLPSHPPSSPHTATPAHFSRSRFFLQDAAASLQALSSIPSALKPCNFLGGRLAYLAAVP